MTSEPNFKGHIGRYTSESTPHWPDPPQPAPGSPNVVFVMLDDVGFAHLGSYGSSIDTPNMDRLAANGIRYNNFHTTTLCSPSRACLLTGRNHHSVGMRTISNYDTGFPSARGAISPRAATIAQMLQQAGYNTGAFGKWHAAPMADGSAVGPFHNWPLGKGFERYYGFLDALTDQFAPELIVDNRHVPSPSDPNYHLTEAIVDEAIDFVRDQTSLSPNPFFLYVSFGACHSPHQAPQEYLDKYSGKFDQGWDATREEWFQRQKELGIVPPDTELAPRNNGVDPWDSFTEDQKRVRTRLQEAFAAMLDHMDHNIGRLADYLEEIGQIDNTLFVVVSDNGASQEGGPLGVVNEGRFYNQIPASEEENLAHVDEIGGPKSHTNYPWGWAQVGNTPLKRYKAEHPRRGHPRPAHHPLARPHQGHGGDPAPVPPHLRHRAHGPGGAGAGGAGELPGRAPDAHPRHEHALHVRLQRRAHAQGQPALRDVRPPRRLARGLEGRRLPSPRNHLRAGPVGALPPR